MASVRPRARPLLTSSLWPITMPRLRLRTRGRPSSSRYRLFALGQSLTSALLACHRHISLGVRRWADTANARRGHLRVERGNSCIVSKLLLDVLGLSQLDYNLDCDFVSLVHSGCVCCRRNEPFPDTVNRQICHPPPLGYYALLAVSE